MTLDAYTKAQGIALETLKETAETNGIIWEPVFKAYDTGSRELPDDPASPIRILLSQLTRAAIHTPT